MGTVQVVFAEDPEDLTIVHAWLEVTSAEVTWLSPHTFFPSFFSRTFSPYFLPVLFSPVFFPYNFFRIYFFPGFFSLLFSPYFFFPTIFPYIFVFVFFSHNFFHRILLSRTIFFSYYFPVVFQKSRRLKSNVLKWDRFNWGCFNLVMIWLEIMKIHLKSIQFHMTDLFFLYH